MTSIRARAVADATTELAPADRIAALARTVRIPPEFARAQRAYRDLQERHIALREQERTLVAEMLAGGGETNASGSLMKRIREVDAELSLCSNALREASENISQTRKPFAKAVAEVLAGERTAAARRGLRAGMELVAEFDVLDAIDRETAAVGGSPQHPVRNYRGMLEPMLARLRRVASPLRILPT
jgi:hypothetical protein